ncbi:CLUMA_CG019778, isoform A [Clunio marinus]|uniref:CLUMA_CG019778, isoform A n=1 Tax=Clunio marinus TaxID=568069 RepID=A0A1J1J324_9DIPT|nr:CLUMA_CG019778, isoform A [Clunio marinus]
MNYANVWCLKFYYAEYHSRSLMNHNSLLIGKDESLVMEDIKHILVQPSSDLKTNAVHAK